ncbi:hypothetical protein [Pectobacterium carotovorum]|uniref:Uncharacterized protein n=1 Tax=Pectobacterium carotovorum subsp. carotovorum TaxID=555 RepID=A0AAI9KZ14_PECCC|nr:hypothetical protein [Pectobacterium carotovorum]GKX46080.1 hypothetical protein SOASR016_08320 [Pectobacterium carotovorum subsp. carotovorum]GLV68384.1 hypothetical protein Pcaca03_08280 [Pectobacterium carotovorum subsp. carotovorum]
MSDNEIKKEIAVLHESVLNLSHEIKANDIFTQAMMFVLLKLIESSNADAIPFVIKGIEMGKEEILKQESGGEPFVRDALDRIDDLMRAIKKR